MSIYIGQNTNSAYIPYVGNILVNKIYFGETLLYSPVITITSQPSNQTASSGAATFSIVATVTPNIGISYQWQKQEGGAGSFANVSGATNSTLSLSGLTSGNDNGDVYRCIVSATGADSVTSNSATLSVPLAAAFSLVPDGWTGAGFADNKLNSVGTLDFPWPEGSFRNATLTAAISGTLRITGIADEGGDCNITQIRVNGVYVWSHECNTPPLTVTTAILAGQQVIFSAGGTFRNVQVWIE